METTVNYNIENLSEEQIKSIALLQHLGNTFFILDDKVFAGDIKESLEAYLNSNDLKEEDKGLTLEEATGNYNFYEYCLFNGEEVEPYDENDYNNDYLVLTDSEADEKAAEYIKDSLWAFTPTFLADETGINYEVFQAIQDNGKCEGNNDAIESCIDDMQAFIDAAIAADGRGHFMSSYDGEENEENVGGETFYIYRIN